MGIFHCRISFIGKNWISRLILTKEFDIMNITFASPISPSCNEQQSTAVSEKSSISSKASIACFQVHLRHDSFSLAHPYQLHDSPSANENALAFLLIVCWFFLNYLYIVLTRVQLLLNNGLQKRKTYLADFLPCLFDMDEAKISRTPILMHVLVCACFKYFELQVVVIGWPMEIRWHLKQQNTAPYLILANWSD